MTQSQFFQGRMKLDFYVLISRKFLAVGRPSDYRHDPSQILGVFDSLELAKSNVPNLDWYQVYIKPGYEGEYFFDALLEAAKTDEKSVTKYWIGKTTLNPERKKDEKFKPGDIAIHKTTGQNFFVMDVTVQDFNPCSYDKG